MRRGHTIVFHAPGVPLEYREEDIPDPGPGEILIRTALAGVCGSDVHRLAGDLPAPREPVCFGHEGVGTVEAVGPDVAVDHAGRPLAPGARVFWFPAVSAAPCGHCPACRSGQSIFFCAEFVWPIPARGPNAAAFREYATVGMRAPVLVISEDTSFETVIALGCALPTAIGGLDRLGEVAGIDVVIQGCGPVGLACTALVSIAGARQVIVIGDPATRLAAARRLGATETISLADTDVEERRARILDLVGGVGAGAVIEAAGQLAAFPEGLDLLGVGGRYLVLGLYSGSTPVPINPVVINNKDLTVLGSLGNPVRTFARTLAVAAEHGERLGFADLITHRFPLERTEEAVASAARGEAVKAVVASA